MKVEIAQGLKWINEHIRELQEKYPDMYIAVYRGKIIAADKDLKKVCERARPYGENVIIKYVFSGDPFVL